jgi:hypothetical protein
MFMFLISVILHRPDGLKSSSKRLLLCCKTLHLILSLDIDPDLHKRMDNAVQDGRIKCLNMRESEADGDQDLHLWASELEDVVLEIMEDPVFKGNQNFKFEMDLDEAGKRLFGGEANAGVSFQIGQLRCVIIS